MKIKRERVFTYLFMFVLLGAIILGLYFVNVKLTGQVILQEQYTNQTSCENAQYVWHSEACYDEEPVCANDFLELCNETNCVDVGQGHWYDANEVCYDEQPVCANDFLELCNETNCVDVGQGHWYDANEDGILTCNAAEEPSCSNDLSFCNETNCVNVGGGHWYDANEDGTSTCNAEVEPECVSNSDCASDYECDGGVCVEETIEEETTEETTEETIVIPEVVQENFVLSAADIQPVSISQAGSKEIKWLVTNTGPSVLSECQVNDLAQDSRISFSDESFNLNPGEQREFVFDVTIPEETEEGTYTLRVFLKCYETFAMKDFNVNVFKKEIGFELIDAQRIRKDRVRVFYNLEELSGNDQDVEIGFFLLNQDGQEVSEIKENKTLSASSVKEFRTTMEINESLMPVNESTNEPIESNLTLVVDLNSEIYSSSVHEPITLGAPIGGFAVFGGIGTGGIIAIIVILVSIAVFFIVRKIRKNKTK